MEPTHDTKPPTPASSPVGGPTQLRHQSVSPAQRAKILGVALLTLVSMSAGFVGGWFGAESRATAPNTSANRTASRQVISSEGELISTIAKEVGESVVSVNATSQASGADFFGMGGGQERESAGTGFILSTDGVIITNRHVVPAGVSSVSVVLSDGTELSNVEVIGRTNDNDPLDVAFLRVKDKKGKQLKPVALADSSKVQVGERVVAIGNALGQFQNTVTSGIISGYGRSVEAGGMAQGGVESLQNLFQTDAAINQGNSGGPLVNASSQVIGINTAVAGNAQNIGFAIPVNDIQGLIKSVLQKGKLERPYLGVRYVSVTDDYAYQFNLPVKRGAYIPPSRTGSANIVADSPAAKAGLQEKDIIVKIEDTNLDESHSLASILGKFEVGKRVQMKIMRDGKEQTIDITLEASPAG